MKIRNANSNDALEISSLIRKSTECNPNNYSKTQQEIWIAYNCPAKIELFLRDRIIICAVKDDSILGTIALKNDEVLGFYVDHDLRGLGIGTALMDYIEKIAIQNGHSSLQLTSTPSAMEFYRRKGFISIENVVVNIDGIDFPEMLMKKELKS